MPAEAQYQSLPFDEAIKFFRQKVRIPTERWNDLWQGMHARGFMIAGAQKDELLADFQHSLDAAIAKGESLEQFRRRFDGVVAKHGWDYNGSRNWRSQVIYETNIRTSYMAGRYRQMTDPDVLKANPYWLYKHGDSRVPRPLHLSWDGLVLRADDPWWQTHWPPKGWGCKCKVFSLSGRDLKSLGKSAPDQAPDDGTYKWADKITGEVHTIPKGVDPGFAYNVGEAAYGRRLSDQAMQAWDAQGAQAWEQLTPGDWQTYARPERLPLDAPQVEPVDRVATRAAMERVLLDILGGEEKMFTVPGGASVNVNAATLAEHLDPARSAYLPFIAETLSDPFEVWLAFEQHKGTGQVVLRERIVKGIATGKNQGFLMVANAVKGQLEAWTFIPTNDLKYVNRNRAGKLLYGRK